MARKPRKRAVHYFTQGFHDGAVVACLPKRKPSDAQLKQDGCRVDEDEDCVCWESFYGSDEALKWDVEHRVRSADILSNRLNTRRALRELVLPELKAIQKSIDSLHERLDRIEKLLAKRDR